MLKRQRGRGEDLTHHPFDALTEILTFFEEVSPNFPDGLQMAATETIKRVGNVARSRAPLLEEGYPRSRAEFALKQFTIFAEKQRMS